MRTMKLAPSVFGAGIGNLSQQLKILEENNVELLHVDVMDGHFVEKMAFGPDHIKMLKELTTIPLDVHLMIEKPERKLDTIIDAGADIITIHQESTTRLYSCIEKIKSRGVKAGVVLSPATNEDTLKYVLDKIDMILLMTINPGEAGPGFHEELLTKIKNVRELIGISIWKLTEELTTQTLQNVKKQELMFLYQEDMYSKAILPRRSKH